MRVYQFLNHEFGLKSIRERRLKVSQIDKLNDPFEFLGADLSDSRFRKVMQLSKAEFASKNGLLCFSKTWRNPVLWGHYANNHRGLCLGFDVPNEILQQVNYVNSRFPAPADIDEHFMRKLLLTKFTHWSYEDEYRVYITLETSENGLYYENFSDNIDLKQVIVGPESSVTRSELSTALGDLANTVEVFKARAAFKTFRVVRNENPARWV